MMLKDYNSAPANIKARLVRLSHKRNCADGLAILTNRIYNALSMAKKNNSETTKYNDFIYILEAKEPLKRKSIYFDRIGYDEMIAKDELSNAKIQIAYLEFLDETNSVNVLPDYLHKAGLYKSYFGAWQAVNSARFSKRADVREYVLNWLKERGKEVKL